MKVVLRFTCSFFFLCVFVFSARAANFSVTNTQDTGAGSLRQAFIDANANPGDDTIDINIPLPNANCNGAGQCAITLASGEILLNTVGTTTVNNPTGAGKLEIRGNFVQRLFFIDAAARLVLNGVTLTGGGGRGWFQPPLDGAGGAVYVSSGELVLNSSVVSDNYNTLDVAAANIKGGGIYIGFSGRAVLNQTYVTRNKSSAGAGIFNQGVLTVNNSTIARNEGITNPANSINSSTGGGILSQGSGTQTYITNSTVSDNVSTLVGGIETRDSSPLVLTNVTIAFNQATGANGVGGITANLVGTVYVRMRNTIVSDNLAPGANGNANIFGKYQSGGRNLLGAVDTTVVQGFTANDFINSSTVFLTPLASNGGLTPTIVPQANSAAINAGDNCVRTQLCPDFNASNTIFTDQRGVSRFSYGQTDIGAVERQFVNINTPSNLPNGRQGLAYAQMLFASGGTEPYTFTVTDGALPGGLTLRADGFLSGTPNESGTFNFTVQVTDSSPSSGFTKNVRLSDEFAPQAISSTKAFQMLIFPPTAAAVTIGGRILTADGRGIGGARVVMTGADGASRFALTNPFGFYHFSDVAAGATYIFSVSSRRHVFTPSMLVLTVSQDAGDIDFVAGL